MKATHYFQSSYLIEIEEYKLDEKSDIVIPTGTNNFLEKIDMHWIQHTDDYDTRNKYYKEEDHGAYTINVGSFHITGFLDRPRLMEDSNVLLLTMGM